MEKPGRDHCRGDVRGEALVELEKRASRAGATVIKTVHLEYSQPAGPFDLVLLDAPCSGTGTWRRQPELRWRLTPARLEELTALQDRLLDQAAALVGPGRAAGLCHLLLSCPWKTSDRVAAIYPPSLGFAPLDLSAEAGRHLPGGHLPGLGQDFRASLALTGTDGFFCAALRRE